MTKNIILGLYILFVTFVVTGCIMQRSITELEDSPIAQAPTIPLVPDNQTGKDFGNDYATIPNHIQPQITKPPPPPPPKLYVTYGGLQYEALGNGIYFRDGKKWKAIEVDTTAYTWKDDPANAKIGNGKGITSTGKNAITTKGIAADPRILPYGTVVHVEGYGVVKVDDTGGKMRQAYRKGQTLLDLRVPQKQGDKWISVSDARKKALKHGRKDDIIVLVQM